MSDTEYVNYIYPEPAAIPKNGVIQIAGEFAMLFESDMAYLRGDFEVAKEYYRSLDQEDDKKMVAATIASVCAVSSGDYRLFEEIQAFAEEAMKKEQSEVSERICQIPMLTSLLSMYSSEKLPEWLVNGDLSDFEPGIRMVFTHLYLMYLVADKKHIEVYAVAKQAHASIAKKDTFTYLDIYFLLYQAYGASVLEYEDEAIACVDEALDLGIPMGIVTPFAELLVLVGEVLKNRVMERYPETWKLLKKQWSDTSKQWVEFHNRYSDDQITNMLTLQETYVAALLVRDFSYEQCAKKMHLSLGRVKNIISSIYSKLYIKNKKELKKFIR